MIKLIKKSLMAIVIFLIGLSMSGCTITTQTPDKTVMSKIATLDLRRLKNKSLGEIDAYKPYVDAYYYKGIRSIGEFWFLYKKPGKLCSFLAVEGSKFISEDNAKIGDAYGIIIEEGIEGIPVIIGVFNRSIPINPFESGVEGKSLLFQPLLEDITLTVVRNEKGEKELRAYPESKVPFLIKMKEDGKYLLQDLIPQEYKLRLFNSNFENN